MAKFPLHPALGKKIITISIIILADLCASYKSMYTKRV